MFLGISTAILIAAGAGLIAGWFLLPAPKFVVNLWAKLGLVDRVP